MGDHCALCPKTKPLRTVAGVLLCHGCARSAERRIALDKRAETITRRRRSAEAIGWPATYYGKGAKRVSS